ncbi:MAG: hypothetical protein U0Q21_01340 [Dermatophilaceae bacterium]
MITDRIRPYAARLVAEAGATISRARLPHYHADPEATAHKLAALLDAMMTSLDHHEPLHLARHVDSLATERFLAGYHVEEVLASFNALESALWQLLVEVVPADTLVRDLGRIGAVLGAGKDQIASRYVELATQRHSHGVDLRQLEAAL